MVDQLNFATDIEYFICCLRDVFLFLVWHLSNSISNTSVSGVKYRWTTLYKVDWSLDRTDLNLSRLSFSRSSSVRRWLFLRVASSTTRGEGELRSGTSTGLGLSPYSGALSISMTNIFWWRWEGQIIIFSPWCFRYFGDIWYSLLHYSLKSENFSRNVYC